MKGNGPGLKVVGAFKSIHFCPILIPSITKEEPCKTAPWSKPILPMFVASGAPFPLVIIVGALGSFVGKLPVMLYKVAVSLLVPAAKVYFKTIIEVVPTGNESAE